MRIRRARIAGLGLAIQNDFQAAVRMSNLGIIIADHGPLSINGVGFSRTWELGVKEIGKDISFNSLFGIVIGDEYIR